MPLIGDSILPAASARVWPHAIGHSALFDGVDDSLTRTPASEGNRRTWTYSCWFRPAKSGSVVLFEGEHPTSGWTALRTSVDQVYFADYLGGYRIQRNAVAQLTDQTAFYHLLCVVDTTEAVADDRAKLYLNGARLTEWTTNATTIAQNEVLGVNTTQPHGIMASPFNHTWAGGYLAQAQFVDGQALTPDDFGEWSDKVTGLWVPKEYKGAYGTNGFHLDFANAAALGGDVSGQGNAWAVNGAPVQTLDTPTNTHATLNPAHWLSTRVIPATFSEGNLRVTHGTSAYGHYASTIALPRAGKWYWEYTLNSDFGSGGIGGAANMNVAWFYRGDIYAATPQTGLSPVLGTGDVVSALYDADAATVTFLRNNVAHGVAVNIAAHMTDDLFAMAGDWANTQATDITARFGATGFTYSPPDGYLSLCSANLHDPETLRSSTLAGIVLRTGTGVEASVTGLEFAPDFAVLKSRTFAESWGVFDTVRGDNQRLIFDGTNAQQELDPTLGFTSTGYDLAGGPFVNLFNKSGQAYLDLCLKAGSQSGFEIVTYTGTGVARSVGHSLGKAPAFMLVKATSAANGWRVYHAALGATQFLQMTAGAVGTGTGIWNDTAPTGTTFTIGDNVSVNEAGVGYVAYLFTDSDIFKAFSFTGSGNADGPFVHLGGRPLAIPFWKGVGTTNWFNFDAARNPYNPVTRYLLPSAPNGEGTDTYAHCTSNGMKVKTALAGANTASQIYVGLAILQSTKYSNAF